MNGSVAGVGTRGVEGVGGMIGATAAVAGAPSSVLPAPELQLDAASADVMSLLYALTAKQRDKDGCQRASAAERKGTERKQAFEDMRAEIQKAKDAKEDGGWLGAVVGVLDAVTDAVVGGNILQDVAHRLSEATGVKAFDIAYDFIRPDAMLHGAVVLASAATGRDEIAQAYDAGAMSSSLKTRFEGAADMSGSSEVMDAYAITRDAMAAAAVTVGTCGVGTVAVVAVATSAALMIEAKADLLGELGVDDKTKMWLRMGAQAAVVVGTVGGSLASGAQMVSGGAKAATLIVNGSNQVARGSVQVGEAMYEKASSDHLTESAKHQNTQHRADREQQRLINGLREVSTSYQRSLETIVSTMNQRDQTPLMLARSIA